MASTKAAAAKAATAAVGSADMVVLQPVKYGGKRYLPGEPLLAAPDDASGLIDAGLATPAKTSE